MKYPSACEFWIIAGKHSHFPHPFTNSTCSPRSSKNKLFTGFIIPACSPHPEDSWTGPVRLVHVNLHIPTHKGISPQIGEQVIQNWNTVIW